MLRASPVAIDARRFEQIVSDGRARAANAEWSTAATAWSRALELWRGPPLIELGDWSPGLAEEKLRVYADPVGHPFCLCSW